MEISTVGIPVATCSYELNFGITYIYDNLVAIPTVMMKENVVHGNESSQALENIFGQGEWLRLYYNKHRDSVMVSPTASQTERRGIEPFKRTFKFNI